MKFKIHDMAAAAFIVARNLPFPSIEQERGRHVFVFDDPDGSVKETYEEFMLDDPFDVTGQISARKLFIAWRAIRNALRPREERR